MGWANVDNHKLPCSVWQDLAAVQGRTPHSAPPDNGPGREIVYPGSLRPNLVEYISYDVTDFLQTEGDIALACPADLETISAALSSCCASVERSRSFPFPTTENRRDVDTDPLHNQNTFPNNSFDDCTSQST